MAPITTNLKFFLLNAENLFLLSDQPLGPEHLKFDEIQWRRLSTSIYENKPLAKLRSISQVITDENPDVILFCEVGGLESLRNFNRLFLNEAYSPALLEGNSNRNIDIGFLIRKNIGFYFDLVSNKNRSIQFLYSHERDALKAGLTTLGGKSIQPHRFSRDAAELHFFLQDREKPFMTVLLSHLKSRLDPDGIDPSGFERRRAELNTLIQIYNELDSRFKGQIPLLVAGDFNGTAMRATPDAEFAELYQKTQLEDVCELAGLPIDARATYYQVNRSSRVEGRQLDYCFVSPTLARYLNKTSVHVHRYKDPWGSPLNPPTTLDAKTLLPSDHYPLVFEIVNLPVF